FVLSLDPDHGRGDRAPASEVGPLRDGAPPPARLDRACHRLRRLVRRRLRQRRRADGLGPQARLRPLRGLPHRARRRRPLVQPLPPRLESLSEENPRDTEAQRRVSVPLWPIFFFGLLKQIAVRCRYSFARSLGPWG